MFSKIRNLCVKYRDIIVYLLLGVLTAIVTMSVYIPMVIATDSATLSNIVSWVAAAIFAYVTDKPLVFHSHNWSFKVVCPEFLKFTGSRIFSLLIETAIVYYFADYLLYNAIIVKALASLIVVVINYFASKLIVFRD